MIEAGLALCHDPFGFAQGRIFDCEPQNWRLCAQDDGLALNCGWAKKSERGDAPKKEFHPQKPRVGHPRGTF
jgi:hypothetical protein